MFPLLAYLMDSAILDILDDDSELDDLVIFESDDEEEEEDETEEEFDIGPLEMVYDDSDESNQGEERALEESPDSEDSDEDEDAPTAPKQRRIQNSTRTNGAGTSSDTSNDDNRPSTSRQHSVDLRHSVQLQLAPQPTLYQQDEQLEPQPIRIQARSILENTSSFGVLSSSAQILEQGIVVVPQLQQFLRADIMQLVSNQSTTGGGESNHHTRNDRIHYLHLYPREE